MKLIFRPEQGEEHLLVLCQRSNGKVTTIPILIIAALMFVALLITILVTDLTLTVVAIFAVMVVALFFVQGRKPWRGR